MDGLNELDNREGKELRNCMEADMAQEEQHSQAASQALGKPFAHPHVTRSPDFKFRH